MVKNNLGRGTDVSNRDAVDDNYRNLPLNP